MRDQIRVLVSQVPEFIRRNSRVHFTRPLKERIVGEVGYGLSIDGVSAEDS